VPLLAERQAAAVTAIAVEEPQTEPQPAPQPLPYAPLSWDREGLAALAAINSNFIGWLYIPRTQLSYPVVLACDNDYYLNHSFRGNISAAGTIFMDYRSAAGFASDFTILYGHNMLDGSMFATLVNYLNTAFLQEHPEVWVTTLEGELLVYRVLKARVTDAWDGVYALEGLTAEALSNLGIAEDALGRVLLLSTCLGWNADARLLIYLHVHE